MKDKEEELYNVMMERALPLRHLKNHHCTESLLNARGLRLEVVGIMGMLLRDGKNKITSMAVLFDALKIFDFYYVLEVQSFPPDMMYVHNTYEYTKTHYILTAVAATVIACKMHHKKTS